MSSLAVIPARMESSRFFGKPLAHIAGIPMITHCYERALLCPEIDHVVIATPNKEIMDYCKQNNIESILTSSHHQSCLLYTSPSPRDRQKSRMPSSA